MTSPILLSPSEATHLYNSEWWVGLPVRAVLARQLWTLDIIMPLWIFIQMLSSFFHRHIKIEELFPGKLEKLQRDFITLTTAE